MFEMSSRHFGVRDQCIMPIAIDFVTTVPRQLVYSCLTIAQHKMAPAQWLLIH